MTVLFTKNISLHCSTTRTMQFAQNDQHQFDLVAQSRADRDGLSYLDFHRSHGRTVH